jgi:hypothetical protein
VAWSAGLVATRDDLITDVAALLKSLLFLPAREILATPAQAGLAFEEVATETGGP